GPNGFASALYFQGGFASYSLIDTGPGVVNTLIPWTADGLRVTLTLNNASGGYTLSALHPNSTLYSFTRTLGGSNTSITSLRVYSSSGGGSLTDREYDVYFNNLTISVIPEASAELLMATAAVAGVVVAAWRRRGESRCCPNA
ncbi:MAG TPA: hypothetical protein PKC18_09135, partial [Lacipirellulaceae bacterium]|nr:hypothetical protein [Lacipirellulaceae bacterium]